MSTKYLAIFFFFLTYPAYVWSQIPDNIRKKMAEIDEYISSVNKNNSLHQSITEGVIVYGKGIVKKRGGFEYYDYYSKNPYRLYKVYYAESTSKYIRENYYYKNNTLVYAERIESKNGKDTVVLKIYLNEGKIIYQSDSVNGNAQTLVDKGKYYLKDFYKTMNPNHHYSKIDRLNDEEDVEKFLLSLDRRLFRDFDLWRISDLPAFEEYDMAKKIADSLKIAGSFYKADLDNNGFTDLVVTGLQPYYRCYVIMNFGDNYKITGLSEKLASNWVVPEISKFNNENVLNIYYTPAEKQDSIIKKVLVYKFGDFIEYNPYPEKYRIEKIEFETSMCFGTCPVFKISIDSNMHATYNAIKFNFIRRNAWRGKEWKGKYTGRIKEKDYNKIIELLNYLDFPNLEDHYAVNWTDDQGCKLIITYNNGQVKKISDYGLIGTFGLNLLYDLLFELRYNQEWKKVFSK